MNQLDGDHKLYAVERHAQFAKGTQIIAEMEVLWPDLKGKLTPQLIGAYNPGTVAGKRLCAEHLNHFENIRDDFLADRRTIGLSHANYRLRLLQGLIDHEEFGENPYLIKEVVELTEKIEGGMFRKEKKDDGGVGDALKELRTFLEVPLTAAEAGPVEAAAREEKRTREREEEARAALEAADLADLGDDAPDADGLDDDE